MDEDGDSSEDMITYGGGDGDDDERSSVCKREGKRKRETERLKISKHYSLSKYKSKITQRLINDRQREEKRWYTYIHPATFPRTYSMLYHTTC